jgi:hypothetical protein
MKLPLGATLQARTISAPAAGKWTAEVCVPTTENSRHEIPNLYCYLTSLHYFTSFKIAFVSITRKLSFDWATKEAQEAQSCVSVSVPLLLSVERRRR